MLERMIVLSIVQVVSTVDPFGYYAEGIQQRLDDAFVEGETSSQAADPSSPSANEPSPSVLNPSHTLASQTPAPQPRPERRSTDVSPRTLLHSPINLIGLSCLQLSLLS